MTQRAFSLIELLACLVLLSLVAGVTMISAAGQRATIDRGVFIQRFGAFESRSRQLARSQQTPVRLTYQDRPQWLIRQTQAHDGHHAHEQALRTTAPYTLDALWLQHRGGRSPQGELAIGMDGASRSYLLQVQPERSDAKPFWLLVAGGTGQVRSFERESDAQPWADMLQTGRFDLD